MPAGREALTLTTALPNVDIRVAIS